MGDLLDRLRGVWQIWGLVGAEYLPFKSRGRLRIVGATVSDDPVQEQTVITFGAGSVTFAAVKAALEAATASVGLNGFKLVNLGAPASSGDAATKGYVDTTAGALEALTVTAGAGLTGGGAVGTNPTLNVAAGDGSIVVDADAIRVGEISDTNHGSRGGAELHAVAIPGGDAGFMSGADKQKLDGLDATIAAAIEEAMGTPVQKSISLTASGATVDVPLFVVTGNVSLDQIAGEVDSTLGNVTGAYLYASDGTTTVEITDSAGGDLSGAVSHSLIARQSATDPLSVISAATVAGSDITVIPPSFFLTAKNGGTTTIYLRYTTTDTPTSGSMTFYLKYRGVGSGSIVAA